MKSKIENLIRSLLDKSDSDYSHLPEEKKSAVVDTASEALTDEIESYTKPESSSLLQSLMGGMSSGSASAKASSGGGMLQNISGKLVSLLVSKAGIDQQTAQKLASDIVPAAISMLSSKAGGLGKYLKGING